MAPYFRSVALMFTGAPALAVCAASVLKAPHDPKEERRRPIDSGFKPAQAVGHHLNELVRLQVGRVDFFSRLFKGETTIILVHKSVTITANFHESTYVSAEFRIFIQAILHAFPKPRAKQGEKFVRIVAIPIKPSVILPAYGLVQNKSCHEVWSDVTSPQQIQARTALCGSQNSSPHTIAMIFGSCRSGKLPEMARGRYQLG